jgi:hypothetical protein
MQSPVQPFNPPDSSLQNQINERIGAPAVQYKQLPSTNGPQIKPAETPAAQPKLPNTAHDNMVKAATAEKTPSSRVFRGHAKIKNANATVDDEFQAAVAEDADAAAPKSDTIPSSTSTADPQPTRSPAATAAPRNLPPATDIDSADVMRRLIGTQSQTKHQ